MLGTLKHGTKGLLCAAALLASGNGFARTEIIDVMVSDLFAPVGFDDNDQSLVVLDGYLPSSCYNVGEPRIEIDNVTKTVKVEQQAAYFQGIFCLQALVPFTTVAKVGVLPKGNYTVVSSRGTLTEKMAVKEAATTSPDDYMYAPVERVSIKDGIQNSHVATFDGRFTNSCMEWDKVKVFNHDKTIEVLPIVKLREVENCEPIEKPFRITVDLPKGLTVGRHLLHVRTLNGGSLNAVFSVYDQNVDR